MLRKLKEHRQGTFQFTKSFPLNTQWQFTENFKHSFQTFQFAIKYFSPSSSFSLVIWYVKSLLQGSHHIVSEEEQAAYADWINTNLAGDKDLVHKLNISDTGVDLYEKMDDGILLCKIINLAVPDTIDERAINIGKNISLFKVTSTILFYGQCCNNNRLSAIREPNPGHKLS